MRSIRAAIKVASDDELMPLIAGGDQNAFAEIVTRYTRYVGAVIGKMHCPAHLQDEVHQRTLLRIWRSARTFDPAKGNLKGWISRITSNEVLRAVGSSGVKQNINETFSLDRPIDGGTDFTSTTFADRLACQAPRPHEAVEEDEDELLAEKLLTLIDFLPPEQAEVMRLHYVEEWTYEAIAKHQQVAISTTLSRARYAVAKLQEWVTNGRRPGQSFKLRKYYKTQHR